MQQEQPPPPRPPSGIELFANILAALVRTVWGRNAPIPPVLIANAIRPALHNYISRHAQRFAAIAARWRAGTLRRPPTRTPRDPDAAPIYNQPRKPRPEYDPPRTRGWLGQVMSYQGRCLGGAMHHLIRTDPEIRALLEAAPQLTRVLGPLLRALNQTIEPGLLPPLPPRAPRRPLAEGPPRASPLFATPEQIPPRAGTQTATPPPVPKNSLVMGPRLPPSEGGKSECVILKIPPHWRKPL